jgi:hypothetical protein
MKGTSPSRAGDVEVAGHEVPRWEVRNLINSLQKGKSMSILFVGIDLAKQSFVAHAVTEGSWAGAHLDTQTGRS